GERAAKADPRQCGVELVCGSMALLAEEELHRNPRAMRCRAFGGILHIVRPFMEKEEVDRKVADHLAAGPTGFRRHALQAFTIEIGEMIRQRDPEAAGNELFFQQHLLIGAAIIRHSDDEDAVLFHQPAQSRKQAERIADMLKHMGKPDSIIVLPFTYL